MRTLRILEAAGMGLILAYLGGAFVMADMTWIRDVWSWDPSARAMMLWMSAPLAMFGGFIASCCLPKKDE